VVAETAVVGEAHAVRSGANISSNVDLMDSDEFPVKLLAESENMSAWLVDDPDGERNYHLELNQVTVHFFWEEWQEFLELVRSIGPD